MNNDQRCPTPISTLPVELFERVFSHIQPSQDDPLVSKIHCRRTLLTLSSICRHFRALILPRLFEEITVEQQMQPTEVTVDKSRTDLSSGSTRSFCAALAANDPAAIHLGDFVRKCVLVTTYVMETTTNGSDCRSLDFYFHALQRMKYVQGFAIRGYACLLEAVSPLKLVPHFSQLSSLVLTELEPKSNHFYVSSRELDCLRSVSTSTTHLELRVGDIRFMAQLQPTGQEGLDIVLAFTNLRSVCIAGGFIVPFMRQALENDTCRNLEEVEFGRLSTAASDPELPLLVEFLNNTLRLTTLRLHIDKENAIEELPPLEGLLASSLPLLSVLRCPPAWFKHFLPGRPVREVDCSASWFRDDSDKAPTMVKEDLPYLLTTKEPIRTLKLDAFSYHWLLCPRLAGEAADLELPEFTLVLYHVHRPFFQTLGHDELPAGESVNIAKAKEIMETIACRTSSTATRVRLQYFCTTLDLPYQHSVVSTCIPLAFPDATRVQLGPWIEWKKNESGEWTPGLHDERAGDRKSVV